jgi:hypothetical protein
MRCQHDMVEPITTDDCANKRLVVNAAPLVRLETSATDTEGYIHSQQ